MIEYRRESNAGFDETSLRIKDAVSAAGFGVLAEIETGKILKSKGFDYPQMNTYEVCNPSYASRILSLDRAAEVLLPCRIIVKETEKGAEVAAQVPTEMIKLLQSPNKDEIFKIASEIDEIMKSIVRKVANGN